MRILHLLNSDRFSGAENVVCQIARMLEKEPNIEVLYCSRDGQIREALEERRITFVPLEAMSAQDVKRVIRDYKPDVIHAHDMRAGFVAARVCGRIPLISHIHNNAYDSRGLSLKSIAYLLAARKAKHIFWVSKSAYEGYFFHRLFRKKSEILYNIIDIDALYEKMRTDQKRYDYDVVYVGRLTYPKNPQRLLRVFSKVAERLPTVKLAIVGSGEMEEEVKALCDHMNLQDRVHFLGFQTNPLKILHDSKVMVMTSRWEGTPMCALEAMALGVPIVSTPVDGLTDLIKNGKNGYLSDDDDALAEQIVAILTNKDYADKLSAEMIRISKEINLVEKYRKAIFDSYS